MTEHYATVNSRLVSDDGHMTEERKWEDGERLKESTEEVRRSSVKCCFMCHIAWMHSGQARRYLEMQALIANGSFLKKVWDQWPLNDPNNYEWMPEKL